MEFLTNKRYEFNPDWTLGELYILGIKDGYTVEDEIRDQNKKVYGETAIPYGKYLLGLRQSPEFSSSFLYSDSANILIETKDKIKYPQINDFRNHDLIWVKNIPGFEFVLIHWGNTDDDSSGCLIVGAKPGFIGTQKGVLQSRTYYKSLYPRIYKQIKEGNKYIEYTK